MKINLKSMKIDLHIHTVNNKFLDRPFSFSKEKFREYILSNNFDIIAITNHNLFDEANFRDIKETIKDTTCVVFPGIEISLEGGHILVICDDNKENYDLLNNITTKIKAEEHNDKYKMSIDDFNDLVCGQSALIIPHYEKSPRIPNNVISQISDSVFAGEVCSPKKFYFCKKNSRLVPLYFSDIRIGESDKIESYRNKSQFTYIDTDSSTFHALCLAIKENKTYLSSDKMENVFDILNGEACASTGINVLIGKRSSGKTYTLDHIAEEHSKECLYIKQFQITQDCDDDSFLETVNNGEKKIVRDYIQPLNKLFDLLDENNIGLLNNDFAQYISSLKDCATEAVFDLYSKCGLFHFSPISQIAEDNILKLKESVEALLDEKEYRRMIDDIIERKLLLELYLTFISIHKKIKIKNKTITMVNETCKKISTSLGEKSSAKQINKCDMAKVFKNLVLYKKFNSLIESINKNTISEEMVIKKYKKITTFEKQKDKRSWKSSLKLSSSVNIDYLSSLNPSDAYFHYNNDANIQNKFVGDDRYKIFFKSRTVVLNANDLPISGGQKAEYLLFDKLSNYKDYEIVLIDEMESSFDNPFLNQEVVALIKKISNSATILISTHNNNLGVSLKPDFYIYHEVENIDGKVAFSHFCGKSTDDDLVKMDDGKRIKLSKVLLDTMEANANAYNDRKEKYEID